MILVQHLWMCFILSLAETFIFYWICTNFLHAKESQPKLIFFTFLGYYIFQFISYYQYAPLFSAFPYYVVFSLIITNIAFTDHTHVKVLTAHMFVMTNYAYKLLSTIILDFILRTELPKMPWELIQSPATQLTASIFSFLGILIFVLFRRMRQKNKTTLYTAINYVVPVIILALCIRLFMVTHEIYKFYLCIFGILLCTSMFLFYLLDDTEIIDEESQKNAVASKMMALQSEYYQSLEESKEEVTALRHDLKKHLQSLVGLIKMGSYQEAIDYVESVYEAANTMTVPIIGGNNMINIILNNIQTRANEAGIKFTANVMVPAKLPIDNVDVCIVLGNLLDNAIEACNRITDETKEKYINVELVLKKSFIILQITNSYNGEYRLSNNKFQSLKPEEFHGIGLSNVLTVIQKYDGDIKITPYGDVFKVISMIPVNNNINS